MKRQTKTFTGSRPIFTGSPAIVPGGFNLDVEKQNFAQESVVSAGSLAIYDEEKRTVQIIKTAKVVSVADKEITLLVTEFNAPCFAVGDLVLKAGTPATAIASVPSITKVVQTDNSCVITLSTALSVVADDVIEEVITDGASAEKSKERGTANAVTICDVEVGNDETPVDVCADTMQYALYERRVSPIPASQKDANGAYLKGNVHVKLTKSY